MQLVHIVKVSLSYHFCSIMVGDSQKVCILTKYVHHYQNNLFSLKLRQAINKVHGDV